eukprot:TRINITY_DN29150_c0_g1_i1.p1 TRINITY_DN29150_c0_g1~~TRINITY_DN29150_c0_g1_i1.p1  ORF type:complete len:437 (+),score=27.91 TRINITY_DN29150_c0_g1_i1:85-1395(+)
MILRWEKGTAWKRRQQRKRVEARKISLLTGLVPATASHHASSARTADFSSIAELHVVVRGLTLRAAELEHALARGATKRTKRRSCTPPFPLAADSEMAGSVAEVRGYTTSQAGIVESALSPRERVSPRCEEGSTTQRAADSATREAHGQASAPMAVQLFRCFVPVRARRSTNQNDILPDTTAEEGKLFEVLEERHARWFRTDRDWFPRTTAPTDGSDALFEAARFSWASTRDRGVRPALDAVLWLHGRPCLGSISQRLAVFFRAKYASRAAHGQRGCSLELQLYQYPRSICDARPHMHRTFCGGNAVFFAGASAAVVSGLSLDSPMVLFRGVNLRCGAVEHRRPIRRAGCRQRLDAAVLRWSISSISYVFEWLVSAPAVHHCLLRCNRGEEAHYSHVCFDHLHPVWSLVFRRNIWQARSWPSCAKQALYSFSSRLA